MSAKKPQKQYELGIEWVTDLFPKISTESKFKKYIKSIGEEYDEKTKTGWIENYSVYKYIGKAKSSLGGDEICFSKEGMFSWIQKTQVFKKDDTIQVMNVKQAEKDLFSFCWNNASYSADNKYDFYDQKTKEIVKGVFPHNYSKNTLELLEKRKKIAKEKKAKKQTETKVAEVKKTYSLREGKEWIKEVYPNVSTLEKFKEYIEKNHHPLYDETSKTGWRVHEYTNSIHTLMHYLEKGQQVADPILGIEQISFAVAKNDKETSSLRWAWGAQDMISTKEYFSELKDPKNLKDNYFCIENTDKGNLSIFDINGEMVAESVLGRFEAMQKLKTFLKSKSNLEPKAEEESKPLKLALHENIPKNYTGIVEWYDGTKAWFKNSFYHRENGPALEYTNGSKYWYKEGKRHRTDGPAIELADGKKEWWIEGNLHRTDGPAIEWVDGYKEWWIEGERYYFEKEFNEEIERRNQPLKEESVLKLTLHENIPKNFTGIVEWSNGTKSWYKNGNFNREDGPAIECFDGIKEWCIEGKYHRINGPAREFPSGTKEWWIEGKYYSTEEGFKKEVEKRNQAQVQTEQKKEIEAQKTIELNEEWIDNVLSKIDTEEKFLTWIKENPPAVGEWKFIHDFYELVTPNQMHVNDQKLGVGYVCFSKIDKNLEWAQKQYSSFTDEEVAKGKITLAIIFPSWYTITNIKHVYNSQVVIPRKSGFDSLKNYIVNRRTGETKELKSDFHKAFCDEIKKEEEFLLKSKESQVSNESQKEESVLKLTAGERIPNNYTGIVEFKSGNKYWYKDGLLHREDGPAIKHKDGSKEWFIEGKRHRLDGTACEYSSGDKYWYIEGRCYSEEDFKKEVEKRNQSLKEEPVLKLKTNERIPTNYTGFIEFEDGTKKWYKEGLLHRENEPAIEYSNGNKEWWIDGKEYSEESFRKKFLKEPKLIQIAKSEAREVAKRVAVNEITKFVQLLVSNSIKENKLKLFLDSSNGRILFKLMIAGIIPILKQHMLPKYGEILDEVSQEFRIQGETEFVTEILDKVINSFIANSSFHLETKERIRIEIENEMNQTKSLQESHEETISLSNFNSYLFKNN